MPRSVVSKRKYRRRDNSLLLPKLVEWLNTLPHKALTLSSFYRALETSGMLIYRYCGETYLNYSIQTATMTYSIMLLCFLLDAPPIEVSAEVVFVSDNLLSLCIWFVLSADLQSWIVYLLLPLQR